MVSKIEQGADFNFFRKVTVNNAFFTDNSSITFNIKGLQTFTLVNEGTDVVEYSFNGNTLHGDMTPGTPTEALAFDNRRVTAIWFRSAVTPQTIRVEAWSKI